MAYGGADVNDFSVPAAADLSASQYTFMAFDANGRGTISTDATSPIIGVLQNKPNAQDVPARIRPAGNLSKFKFGGVVNENGMICSTSDGMGTATTAIGTFVGAIAAAAVGGSLDIGDVLVTCFRIG